MLAKISDDLLLVARRAEAAGDQELPVIVTVAPDAPLADLEQAGLRVTDRLDFISAVSGSIRAGALVRLAELASVHYIEHDGPVQAC